MPAIIPYFKHHEFLNSRLFIGHFCLIAVILMQGATLHDAITVLNHGFEIETGVTVVDELLNRGGLRNDVDLFTRFLCTCLGGIQMKWAMNVIVERMTRNKRPVTLVAATIISCWYR